MGFVRNGAIRLVISGPRVCRAVRAGEEAAAPLPTSPLPLSVVLLSALSAVEVRLVCEASRATRPPVTNSSREGSGKEPLIPNWVSSSLSAFGRVRTQDSTARPSRPPPSIGSVLPWLASGSSPGGNRLLTLDTASLPSTPPICIFTDNVSAIEAAPIRTSLPCVLYVSSRW